MERLGNDRVAEAVAQHPRPARRARLVCRCRMSRRRPRSSSAACAISTCAGVIISSHVNGIELGDAVLRPFWAKAEALGAVIFIHPAGNSDPRMRRNRLHDHHRAAARGGLRAVVAGLRGRHGRVPQAQNPDRPRRRISAVLYRPPRQRLSLRPLAQAHGRLQQLSAQVLLRHRAVQPGHAGIPGDQGSCQPRDARHRTIRSPRSSRSNMSAAPGRSRRKDQDAILGANAARLFGISIWTAATTPFRDTSWPTSRSFCIRFRAPTAGPTSSCSGPDRPSLVLRERRVEDRRMNPDDGSFVEFVTPTPNSRPIGITRRRRRRALVLRERRQPDRADHDGRRDHRISGPDAPAPDPTASSPGPDGNVWFSEAHVEPSGPDHAGRHR